ncbi:MAG: TonB family protein [Hyphomicrobium sp.]|uniref:energy transducer TonB family protein n=1 Tax=Hyphomicrobium sp. TaxID=82 RepID=UPI0039E23315
MLLRVLAIMFALLAHVAFAFALWPRPRSDELEVLDIARQQEFTLTPMGSAVRPENVEDRVETAALEQAANIKQEQSIPSQSTALNPSAALSDDARNRMAAAPQVATTEIKDASAKTIVATPPVGTAKVISSEASDAETTKSAELFSDAAPEHEVEGYVPPKLDTSADLPIQLRAADNFSRQIENRARAVPIQSEPPLLSDQIASTDAHAPSVLDRRSGTIGAETPEHKVEADQPDIVAAKERPQTTTLEQPAQSQSDGTLTLEQLNALKPRLLQVLAQPQQIELATDGDRLVMQASDLALIGKYMDGINERVQRSKINPRTQSQGTTVLKYTVGTDGSLQSIIVQSTSGSNVLDGAAIKAIHSAAPFAPIPPDVSAKPMTFVQPFRFVLP